jgi:hypothetical protein
MELSDTPYYTYINTCEIREHKTTGAKRKHSTKDGVTFCKFCHYLAHIGT